MIFQALVKNSEIMIHQKAHKTVSKTELNKTKHFRTEFKVTLLKFDNLHSQNHYTTALTFDQ